MGPLYLGWIGSMTPKVLKSTENEICRGLGEGQDLNATASNLVNVLDPPEAMSASSVFRSLLGCDWKSLTVHA